MSLKLSAKPLALFALAFMAGCSVVGDDAAKLFPSAADSSIIIDSVPPGATVLVMDKNVGTTPIRINRNDVFPLTYPREKESLYGMVTLKRTGCSDFTRTVSAKIMDRGLHAELDCNGAKPVAPQASVSHASEISRPSDTSRANDVSRTSEVSRANDVSRASEISRSGDAVEQRLEKIRDFLKKGLITEEEAQKARERALNSL